MLTAKAALAIGALALGSAAFGTVVYLVAYQQPHSDFVPPAIATEASPTPPSIQAPTLVQLEPITILGLRHRTPRAPASASDAPVERQLVACSHWRNLAGGPAARNVRDLCDIPLLGPTNGAPLADDSSP